MKPFYYGRYNSSGADSHMLSFNGAFVLGWSDVLINSIEWDDSKTITGFEMTSTESARYISDLAHRVNLETLRLKN